MTQARIFNPCEPHFQTHLTNFWTSSGGIAQPKELPQLLQPEKSWFWREVARNVAVNPNLFDTQCVQELNESTPAAHVLSVCAYFPNLDMGSELQALRVYVKLAGLSPFHSPDLAAAQHGDAPRRWDYWLRRASCLKPARLGLAGQRGALAHLPALTPLPALPGSSRGKKKCCTGPPFSSPGRSLAPVLCTWVDLDELSAPLLSSSGGRIAASMDGSALKREQLYRVVSMLVGCPLCMGRGRAEHVFFSSRWQSPTGNLVFCSPGREAAVLWIHSTLSKIAKHFWQ